jgi:nucleoside-triphosphatase
MLSSEVRERGDRTGFRLIDVASGRTGVLASTTLPAGPRIGRYRVNLRDLAEIGATALRTAVGHASLVVCDEVGPMELYSPEFRRAVAEVLASPTPLLCVVHARARDPLVERVRSAAGAALIEVTAENRATLAAQLSREVLDALGTG